MEERVSNNTIIKDIESGTEFKIVDAIKTDNQFGNGVYLYEFENSRIRLYRSEFTVVTTLKEDVMFLVMMHCFAENTDIPCVVSETKDKAIEWIDKEMEVKKYSGGCHQIHKIKLYK